jgi:hypothetical protein
MRFTNRAQSILVPMTFNVAFAASAKRMHIRMQQLWLSVGDRGGNARSFSSRRIDIPPPFPVVPSCPEPTCPCAKTPAGLGIDHTQNLNGTMPSHSMQVLISTGQSDWIGRVEEDGLDKGWGMLGNRLRGLIRRGGKYSDVR